MTLSKVITSSLCLFLISCATSPQSRIDQHPGKYSSLPPKHQALAEQGRITKGMSKDGVFLALGKPESVSQGADPKGDFEQWSYYSLSPIMHHRFGGYWGLGGGYRRCGGFGGFGYGPTISYVPKKSASIKFYGNKVSTFQTHQPR